MALANFTDLKAAIADHIHRTDLTTQIPDFISLAEGRINRRIQARLQEKETALTLTAGTRDMALPADYYEGLNLWMTTYPPRDEMVFKSPEQIVYGTDASTGVPTAWTIDGSNITLDSIGDIDYTFDFRYRCKFVLSDAEPTNWLLTNYPDLYLYASLFQAAVYTHNGDKAIMYKQMYDEIAQEVMDKEVAASRSLTALEVDSGLLNRSGRSFNVYKGDF